MKLNIRKIDQIKSLVKQIEGKSTKRLYCHPETLAAVESAERYFKSAKIKRADQIGAEVVIEPEAVCNAYNATPFGTYTRLERFPSGWFVTRIWREYGKRAAYGNRERVRLWLKGEKKAIII